MYYFSNKYFVILLLFSITSLFAQNVVITGNTGVGGVTLTTSDPTPQTITSGIGGFYSFIVDTDGEWDGTITPSKNGYTFTPDHRGYVETGGATNQDYTAQLNTYSITGNAGTGGVTLRWVEGGIQKSTTSKADGSYNVTVSYGWSGTITPSKTGYSFNPINRSYTNVSSNQAGQNYEALVNRTITGNTGTEDATLTWENNGTQATTSNASGDYSITIPDRWQGTVTPTKTGYTFNPTNKFYVEIISDLENESYRALLDSYTISGNTGTGNTTLTWNNGKTETTTSDASGDYSITIPHGWNGTVTPSKDGYTFSPESKSYVEVDSDRENQDYTASLDSYTISGNTEIGDAILTWEDGGTKTTTSDGSGDYSITIPFGWNGIVIPTKDGYNFSPESKSYVEVASDKVNQDYIASQNWYSISGNTGTGDVTLTWDNGGAENTTSDSSGNYSISIPSGWNGTVTPTKDGYTFDPENKGYVEVGSDLENQDYTAVLNQYSITAVANPEVGGTIDSLKPGGEYNNGETVLIIAIPNTGYKFVNWTLSGKEVSTDSSYTFVATANADYVANFELAELVVDCSTNPSDAGTTSGCGTFQLNDEITIAAEANSDWVFAYWTEDGDTVSNNAEYTFIVLKSRNLIANFVLISGVEKIGGSEIIPQNYYLSNAYPNPFNPETTIKFGIPEESNVSLMIFDITGQVIETVLNNSIIQAGNYANYFYADELPSGIYLYLLSANSTISDKNFKKTGKVLLIK